MDVLVFTEDTETIRYLQSRDAQQVDPTGHLWGLRIESATDLRTDLVQNEPQATGWIAEVSDFTTIN